MCGCVGSCDSIEIWSLLLDNDTTSPGNKELHILVSSEVYEIPLLASRQGEMICRFQIPARLQACYRTSSSLLCRALLHDQPVI
jgi:hypothetical protein